jgi:hypothetical protein
MAVLPKTGASDRTPTVKTPAHLREIACQTGIPDLFTAIGLRKSGKNIRQKPRNLTPICQIMQTANNQYVKLTTRVYSSAIQQNICRTTYHRRMPIARKADYI